MLRRTLILRFVWVLFTASLGVANAAPQWCGGTLDRIWVNNQGDVFVFPSWRQDHVRICNLKGLDGVTDAVTCSTWYSQMAQAVKDNRETIIQYSDIPSCATIPTYGNAPVPYYVMLMK